MRYYTGNENSKVGDVVEVFGWYENQEWVKVRLMRRTSLGWLVERDWEIGLPVNV